jgi:hypothetical protein
VLPRSAEMAKPSKSSLLYDAVNLHMTCPSQFPKAFGACGRSYADGTVEPRSKMVRCLQKSSTTSRNMSSARPLLAICILQLASHKPLEKGFRLIRVDHDTGFQNGAQTASLNPDLCDSVREGNASRRSNTSMAHASLWDVGYNTRIIEEADLKSHPAD